MDLFLQYLANGVVVGSSYVLVAVGLTLIFGILHVVNFAHGEFYMLGGYAGITASTAFGLPLPVSLNLYLSRTRARRCTSKGRRGSTGGRCRTSAAGAACRSVGMCAHTAGGRPSARRPCSLLLAMAACAPSSPRHLQTSW